MKNITLISLLLTISTPFLTGMGVISVINGERYQTVVEDSLYKKKNSHQVMEIDRSQKKWGAKSKITFEKASELAIDEVIKLVGKDNYQKNWIFESASREVSAHHTYKDKYVHYFLLSFCHKDKKKHSGRFPDANRSYIQIVVTMDGGVLPIELYE